ncbi:MAG: CCA tRNA nucleotidyltransferase [Alphaproteobacteria bacterium]|nr:CCA tRNA nucleotidyltransferase [Alphaproteobacteria bacterium]
MQKAGTLPPQPWMKDPKIIEVFQALMGEGKLSRFVGGCVRDTLIHKPIYDIDIATAETPENAIRLLTQARIKVKPLGIEHGSILVIHGGYVLNITTLRKDIHTDGRHASVSYVDDWESDAHRRDFTINALYADIDGNYYDPCGGKYDLEQGLVRFIGDATTRIKEDYLRILRFFRFQAWYAKQPSIETEIEACAVYANQLSLLSKERIWQEISKTLQAPNPYTTVKKMCEYGILAPILPASPNLRSLEELIQHEHLYTIQPTPIRRLVCLYKNTPHNLHELSQRLNLSTEDIKRVKQLMHVQKTNPDLHNNYENYKILHEKGRDFYLDYILLNPEFLENGLELYKQWQQPKLPLSGKDLVALGIPEGPQMGLILQELTQWWLKNACNPTRHEALDWLKARNKL